MAGSGAARARCFLAILVLLHQGGGYIASEGLESPANGTTGAQPPSRWRNLTHPEPVKSPAAAEDTEGAALLEEAQRLARQAAAMKLGPPFESIRNKVARAELKGLDGSYAGSVSFEWCHNDNLRLEPGVEVTLNLYTQCPQQWGPARRTDWQPRFSKCAYQISQGHSMAAPLAGEQCKAAGKAWNPLQAHFQKADLDTDLDFILQELDGKPGDNCDSTHFFNRTARCPAGALSRTHGKTNKYYDNNLAKYHKFIGRTLLLAGSTGADGYSLSCSPIRFYENCAVAEKMALLDIKASFSPNGTGSPLETWTPRGDMCEDFKGVLCDRLGHVTNVSLPYTNPRSQKGTALGVEPEPAPEQPAAPKLQGRIPDSIGQLAFLQILDLSGQNLSGALPSTIDGAKNLTHLRLSDNQLTGTLPAALGELKGLEELDVSGNMLQGTVPQDVLELPKLRIINAASNDGICGSFMFDRTGLEVVLEDCSTAAPPPGPVPGPIPSEPAPAPFARNKIFLSLIALAILVLASAICCWSYAVHKSRRKGALLGEVSLEAQGSSKAAKPFDEDGTAALGSGDVGVNVCVFAENSSSKVSEGSMMRSSSAQPAMLQSPLTPGTLELASREVLSQGSLPATPALRTRCPSGYSPLEYACLPENVEAHESRILGSGGYGVVYYAIYHSPSGEQLPAAVKVISNSDYDDVHKSKYKTFQDEIEMLKLFGGNDCIVQVYAYCLDFPRAFIVYEYLPNDTLARTIHRYGVRQSYLQILQIGYGIAEALHALHQRHVVHRDLKPDNILMDAHMRPKLSDFGIARQRDSAVSALSTHNLGTWSYMAPEQFHGKVSEKSDIYAMGLILWECWTLQRPWNAADDKDLWGMVYAILNENKRPEIPEGCPKSLMTLLQDCWETEPALRPTALQLKERIWKIMTVQSRRKPQATAATTETPDVPDGNSQEAGPSQGPPNEMTRQASGSQRSPEPYRIQSPDHGGDSLRPMPGPSLPLIAVSSEPADGGDAT